MIAVGGRKDHSVLKMCKDMDHARKTARQMVSEGFKNITIDGRPYSSESIDA